MIVRDGFLTIGIWLRFLVWMGLGLVVSFGYSGRHSRLAQEKSSTASDA